MSDEIEEIRARLPIREPQHRHDYNDSFYCCPKCQVCVEEGSGYIGVQGPDCICNFDEWKQKNADIARLFAIIADLKTGRETASVEIAIKDAVIAEKDAEVARLKGPDCRCGWVAPTVPQVCEGFVRETRPCPEMGTCINCEHDEECHV
jgi:hypothetical protein